MKKEQATSKLFFYIFLPVLIGVWMLIKIGSIPILLTTLIIRNIKNNFLLACKKLNQTVSRLKRPKKVSSKPLIIKQTKNNNSFSVIGLIFSFTFSLLVMTALLLYYFLRLLSPLILTLPSWLVKQITKAIVKRVVSIKQNIRITAYSFRLSTKKFITKFLHRSKPKIIPRQKPKPLSGKPAYLFQLRFPKFKKRGRPRVQALHIFYLKKFNKFLNRYYPKPFRIATVLLVLAGSIITYSWGLVNIANDLPNPHRLKDISNGLTTEFYDRNGNLLYRLYEGRNRQLIKLDDLPSYISQSTIAMEDKGFYSHPGIDIFGIIRAIKVNLSHGQIQGGSTLTQQLIKNTLLSSDRTWSRKVKEGLLAFWTERIFSKKEILQMYLNEAPYGGPAWGIQAASQMYFGIDAKDLTLAQASYLAGLPASPTTYSPYGPNPQLGQNRQKAVLRRMVEDGYISEEEAKSAAGEELAIKQPQHSLLAPHFVMYTKNYLENKYGPKVVSQGGLKVTTTLDLSLQKATESILAEELSKISHLQVSNGAAMVEDPKTGQILAMVGSRDYNLSSFGNFNVALALRQPGSSIKPITYATAFKLGYTPGTVLLDSPTSFYDGIQRYSPVNYDGKFHGPVTIRTALGSSYNIPAVKMLALVGIPQMIATAKDLGITTLNNPERYGLSLTLGAGEVRLIDMMTAYSVFSQMGVKHNPTPILKVTDASGVVLEDNSDYIGERVLDPGIAYMITDILSDNKARTPAFGEKSQLVIAGHTSAVKTGTTDNKKDNWTFGYTPDFVVGVWVGNNDGKPMHPSLTSGVTGAAPIWNKIMTYVLSDKPNVAFEKPANISEGPVDGHKDLVLNGTPQKSIVVQTKKKKDEGRDNKETITFTDPFSTFTNDTPLPPSQ